MQPSSGSVKVKAKMSESRALSKLLDTARAPLSDWPAQYPGHRAMGYLCSYVSEEIIHAAGYAPLRLRGTSAPLQHVDAHLQSFACALCRSTVDQVLGGDLDFLAGTIFAHTCDTMQAQADLWRMNTGESCLVDTVMQPANLGAAPARPYLIAELSRFRERLASFSGQPITEEALWASIALYDESRRLVERLQETRARLSAPQFYAILDAAQVMPRELFNPLLANVLDGLRDAPIDAGGPRLFLVGAVLDEPRVLDLIEETGAHVVGDDLCSGSRHFCGRVGTGGDAMSDLADYYLRRPPCPTKYHPGHVPGRYVLEQARLAEADGVVFVLEKFCEPHAFDYALVQPELDDAGLPHLLLEMEQTPSLEALRTRLQAFVEML
jgi:bzd-type benzoyl-CoA reductase N subunit